MLYFLTVYIYTTLLYYMYFTSLLYILYLLYMLTFYVYPILTVYYYYIHYYIFYVQGTGEALQTIAMEIHGKLRVVSSEVFVDLIEHVSLG